MIPSFQLNSTQFRHVKPYIFISLTCKPMLTTLYGIDERRVVNVEVFMTLLRFQYIFFMKMCALTLNWLACSVNKRALKYRFILALMYSFYNVVFHVIVRENVPKKSVKHKNDQNILYIFTLLLIVWVYL